MIHRLLSSSLAVTVAVVGHGHRHEIDPHTASLADVLRLRLCLRSRTLTCPVCRWVLLIASHPCDTRPHSSTLSPSPSTILLPSVHTRTTCPSVDHDFDDVVVRQRPARRRALCSHTSARPITPGHPPPSKPSARRGTPVMERFRRNMSPPNRARSAMVASGDAPRGRKRPSIGRAAESFQSKLIASFRSVTRRGDDYANDKAR